MTKRFHKCDETCKHPEEKPKVKKIKTISPKKIAKEITGQMADLSTVKSNPAKIEVIWKIIDMVESIDNSLETNKILEKTLITLRKLQKDIA
jgi:hypothetical protein